MLGMLTNATLLAAWVSAQGMFTAEARGERPLLERIHDGVWRAEELLQYDPHACRATIPVNVCSSMDELLHAPRIISEMKNICTALFNALGPPAYGSTSFALAVA